jgi:gliding motility-associated-like protein
MKRNLLITLFALCALALKAQQPPGACPGGTPALANNCAAACVLCDFTTFTSNNNNPSSGQQIPPNFCPGQAIFPHNVQWVGFVAGTPNITMTVTATNCQLPGNQGLQIGVWGTTDCTSFNLVSNCEYQVPPNAAVPFTMTGLTVGATYFFVVDGFNDDVCDFTVNVTSGSTVVNPVTVLPQIIPSTPPPYCAGGLYTFTSTPVPNAGIYTWTLNGTPISFDQIAEISFPGDGSYQLCVTASNPCHPNGTQNCMTITIGPLPLLNVAETVCTEDLPFVYEGFAFTQTGIYDFSFIQPSGCVQPVRLNLTVIPAIPPSFVEANICQGEAYNFGGPPLLTQTGQYTRTFLSGPNGCDSTVTLFLTAHPPGFENLGLIYQCELFGPYFIGNTPITQSGPFNVLLETQFGCDSTVVGFLEITQPEFIFIDTIVCPGTPVEIGDFFFTAPGNYQNTFTEPGGCENTFQLNLQHYAPVTDLTETICPGQSVQVGNQTFSTTGNYTVTVPSLFLGLGCDSTINLNLTVLDPIVTNIVEEICEGDTVFVGNTAYTTTGNYQQIFLAANGCDSTVNLDLTVFPNVQTTLTESICFGETFTVGDSTFTQSGTYQVDLLTAQGCDSTVTLNLTVKPAILTVLNPSICDGETFSAGGMDFDMEGTYELTLTADDGCDSTVTVNLTVLPNPAVTINQSICQGQTFTVGSNTYDETGTYVNTFLAANGCDSTVTLNLNVLGPIINNITREICTGNSYTVGTSTFDQPGNYTVQLINSIGCDSIVNLTLLVEDVLRDTLVLSICEGESYTVGSSVYDATGFYEDSFVTTEGCDSVFYLDLTVVPTRLTTLNETICDGESVSVGTSTYTTTGTFQDILSSDETGCDSIVTLNLTVLNVPTTLLVESICDGETFGVGSSVYDATGTYTDTLIAANGCDSIITLELTVLEVPTTLLVESICDGEAFLVGNSAYDASGTYTDILVAANGCDSIVTLQLTVLEVPQTFLTEEICEFESFQVGTSVYDASGNYTDTLVAANGCDSIITLALTVHPIRRRTIDASICLGGTYTVGTSVYDQTGNYVDTLTSLVTGCDSIVTLNLDVTDFYLINLEETICEGESFTVGSSVYDQTGNYTDNFISSDGCDSIVNLNLTVLEWRYETVDATICDGETFAMGGIDYGISGTYTTTLTSSETGCDSIVTLNLTVNEVFETDLVEAICAGETYQVGDDFYDSSGVYQNILLASNGCDSTVNLTLTVNPIPVTDLTEVLCFGETYTVGSSTYTSSGVYQDILTSVVTGCDSIVNLDLTIRPEITTSLTEVVCFGETFSVGSSTYDASGTYTDVLSSALTGCDSIVTLNLTVRDEITTALMREICDGETFSVGNSSYSTSGVYTDVLTSVLTGCDSTVTLDLTVHPIPVTDLAPAICDGESFTVGNSTYTTSGIYQDVLTSTLTGCDSIVNLDLTVYPIPVTNITEVLCFGETYTVGSSTYTTSGVYQDVLTSAVTGCDSIVNLDLTIRSEITTSLTEVVCFGETFSVGNSTYDASGTYTDVLTSVLTGCDSIVTLNLTVREEITTALTREICDGETFNVGNSSYTTSGIYTDVLSSVLTGCDSTVTLDLTVHPIPVTALAPAICDGESFTVGNSTYTTSGVYQDVLTSTVTGCDSIVNLTLTVHPLPMTSLVQEICDGESFTVGSSVYTTSGTYQDILPSTVTGCDSIITLALTVHPIPVTNLVQEICDGESFTVGNSTYTASGSYQDVLTSTVTGCDSIVNLALTVNEVYEVFLDEDICQGESFPIGNTSFSQSGTYTEVLSSVAGCDSVVTLNLAVYPCELEYVVTPADASCAGLADGTFRFRFLVGTPPYQYTWQAIGSGLSGSGTIANNNLEQIVEGLPAGQYQINVIDGSPFNVTISFNVTIGQPDPLDISLLLSQYSNFNISCNEETDGSIDATVTGGTPPYSYNWNTGGRTEDLSNLPAGAYALTVSDQNACADSASTVLNAPPPLNAALESIDPPCYGDQAGIVTVNDVSGGVGPYLYSINGAPFSSQAQFTNLPIGIHEVEVQDANGCSWQGQSTIFQPQQLIVDLGIDQEIKLGDSIQLFAQTSYPVQTYSWNSPVELSCQDCPDPFVRPFESIAVSVIATDENGCTASDRMTIFVNRKRDVYIPNVFSPNGDGQNDVFVIFAGPDVKEIKSFYVFNRWGEAMFEITGSFQPSNPSYGWDGTHRGELMNAGVYVYMAEVEFVDGVVELFKGDVLLLR